MDENFGLGPAHLFKIICSSDNVSMACHSVHPVVGGVDSRGTSSKLYISQHSFWVPQSYSSVWPPQAGEEGTHFRPSGQSRVDSAMHQGEAPFWLWSGSFEALVRLPALSLSPPGISLLLTFIPSQRRAFHHRFEINRQLLKTNNVNKRIYRRIFRLFLQG